MKRRELLSGLTALVAGLMIRPVELLGQGMGMGRGGMMGHGHMGHGGSVSIPESLPAPTDAAWIARLRNVLAAERRSQVQYESDAAKFGAHMPYMMVIQQEYDHIAWLTSLFAAYGLPPGDALPPVTDTRTLQEAYAVGLKLETSLVEEYGALLSGTSEQTTVQVLDLALSQSRMHQHMFTRASGMGGMGMGGMVGPDSGW